MDTPLLFVPLTLLAGGLLAVQAGANAQLSRATGSPLAASAVQLAVGLGLLTTAAAAAGALGVLAPLPHVAWWQWFGGLASALYVTSAIVLFPRLGAVVTVGLFIAGQMLASLLLDGGGLIGVARAPIGAGDGLGLAAVLAGAALIVRSHGGTAGAGSPRRSRRGQAGWTVLALAAGAALPVQGAVNARLRAELGQPLTVGAVSFLVATAATALLLLLVVRFTPAPAPDLAGLRRVPWWGWLGGLCGAVYVTSVFTAIPAIGAATAVGLTVAGQQLTSVLFDRYGLMRLPRRAVTPPRLTGVALLLLAVALIQTS
jgi:bacterial/archaeal transporter family-2 protein